MIYYYINIYYMGLSISIISVIIVCILSISLYIYFKQNKIIEPMVFTSNNMAKNIYNKYNIKIDENKELLYRNGTSISYNNNLNSKESAGRANNKIETSKILGNSGLPVCTYVEWNNNIDNLTNLQIINNKLSFPLVIKFNWGAQGKDVFTDVTDNAHIMKKITKLQNEGKKSIILEEQTYGNKYRIMVMNDRIVYTSKDIPPRIIGDGHSTIRELINIYPKKYEVKPITIINEELMHQQGYELDNILELKKEIKVSNVVGISNGGKQKYIEDYEIHPFNINMFLQINKILGLNFSGIDYMTNDLMTPYFEDGKIIEVNPYPGFSVTEQKTPSITDKWVSTLFG